MERYRPVSQPRRRISIIRDRDCRSRFNDDTKMERSFNKGPAIILSRALIADVCLLCDTRVTCARSFACESRTRYSTATYVSYFSSILPAIEREKIINNFFFSIDSLDHRSCQIFLIYNRPYYTEKVEKCNYLNSKWMIVQVRFSTRFLNVFISTLKIINRIFIAPNWRESSWREKKEAYNWRNR